MAAGFIVVLEVLSQGPLDLSVNNLYIHTVYHSTIYIALQ